MKWHNIVIPNLTWYNGPKFVYYIVEYLVLGLTFVPFLKLNLITVLNLVFPYYIIGAAEAFELVRSVTELVTAST